MIYLLISVSVVCMAAAQLLLKKGLLIVGQSPQNFTELFRFFIKSFSNVYVVAAGILIIITAFTWIQAVSRMEISYAYPFMALSYILVALFSMWLFHENITAIRWVGIVVVCAGVFLVSQS